MITRRRIRAGLVAPLLTLAIEALGADAGLTPYTAHYKTTAMGFDVTLERRLSEVDGVYTLRQSGEILLASIEEKARFTIADGAIRGLGFTYALKGLVNRSREVQFLPEQDLIRSLRKKKWTEHPWQADIRDRLSQQEQLRLDLRGAPAPPATLAYRVIDGPRVRDRKFDLIRTETINTKLGPLETLHYRQRHDDPTQRASDIWLAPSLDFLMVRTVHVEDGSEIIIELIDTTIEQIKPS